MPVIFQRFKKGDLVWVLIQTAEIHANPDFEIVQATVEEVVSNINRGTISYRLRLPDGTLAVESQCDCHTDRAAMVKPILEMAQLNQIKIDRLIKACEEPGESET